MNKMIVIVCIVLMGSAVHCGAEGLGTLIALGKSQAEMQKQYAAETKTFEIVKKAIEAGAIIKGMDKASVRSKYGEPIVVMNDLDGKHEDWIYKPAESSFFKGIRATLYFDAGGILDDVKLEER